MSDHLPDLYTGAPNAPETVMVLPRASKPAVEPSRDEPITVLVAARTIEGLYDIPDLPPQVEDRTAPPEDDAPQPDRDTPRRIRRPRMWDLGREQPPAHGNEQPPVAPASPVAQPEPATPDTPAETPDAQQQDRQGKPAQQAPASPRYTVDWAQAWANARYYHDLHVAEEAGWNWPRIKWAWRWIAPAGLGWGLNIIHGETALLDWFHASATSFWTGTLLVCAGGWIVVKTRKQRPIVAWLTRIPLATCAAAWLSLPVTMPALATLTATAIHTTADIANALTHR
jgi:hypothetical protein